MAAAPLAVVGPVVELVGGAALVALKYHHLIILSFYHIIFEYYHIITIIITCGIEYERTPPSHGHPYSSTRMQIVLLCPIFECDGLPQN